MNKKIVISLSSLSRREPQVFYTLNGVERHIHELTNESQQGISLPFVLIKESKIIARANLKNIDNYQAEIGYRVAQSATGQGVASKCVQHLINQAKEMSLTRLVAHVMNNNIASEKALVKNGFELKLCFANQYTHHGQDLHGFLYQLDFTG